MEVSGDGAGGIESVSIQILVRYAEPKGLLEPHDELEDGEGIEPSAAVEQGGVGAQRASTSVEGLNHDSKNFHDQFVATERVAGGVVITHVSSSVG
jgi:hypothetical protein